MPCVALVGYTNAGKSSLLNALTAAGVLPEDTLFATLDPTVRRIVLPSGKLARLTDTVGFIQKLPTQLFDSFRATLEEIKVCCLKIKLCTLIDTQYNEMPALHIVLQCL
jgi:GTP-binding protein HflX